SYLKTYLIRRMFWGRGGLYKSSFHILIMFMTAFILVTNLSSRFSIISSVVAEEELVFSYAVEGNKDVLQQGNSLESIVAVDPGLPEISVKKYTVKKGHSLAAIAKDFKISKDTIKWANSKV